MVRNQINKKVLFLTSLNYSINQLWGKEKIKLKKTEKLQALYSAPMLKGKKWRTEQSGKCVL